MMPYKQLIQKKNLQTALLEQTEKEAAIWNSQAQVQPKVNFAETVRTNEEKSKKASQAPDKAERSKSKGKK